MMVFSVMRNLFAIGTNVSTAEEVLIFSACAVHFTRFAMTALDTYSFFSLSFLTTIHVPLQEKTDDRDEEIARILFTDYWEITRDKEHLTLVDLEEASVFLRLNSKGGVNSDEHVLADNDVNDQKNPCKQNEVNTLLKKKSKRKKTFIGWGSEELIGFLLSVGKDTEKPLDKLEIAGVVKDYIKQKNLYHDAKKVCFLCDDRLQPLFARRKVRCKMIRKFLADHLASSAVSEDENSYGSEDDDTPVMKKRPLNSLEPKIAKRVSERSKRCFAALVHKNINLIYLRRTLVINLLSDPDTFERKVVGCFVRLMVAQPVHSYVKSTKAFVLGRVTGIKKASKEYKLKGTCTSTNILLCLTGPLADVTISMLSDEDFEEDECSVLISSVKEGLLERVTIAEFEEKVATVHTDIVKHWIERELVRLEKNIDRAQNKGLRVEYPFQTDNHVLINLYFSIFFTVILLSYFTISTLVVHFVRTIAQTSHRVSSLTHSFLTMDELLHRKKLLSTPAERQRRLEEVPEIVPETEYEEKETELEVAASNSSQENRGTNT
ncbi:hypothetical protein HU200_054947 [Digitaria exilis]|uniref:Plus3 domain-containing protein n=1 Tax=Digitaria exilis TaxID=1010633 RepID=A0A835AHU2_9POAL|nr:hypothetical protein HU200_054947 [Digitaria exilis]